MKGRPHRLADVEHEQRRSEKFARLLTGANPSKWALYVANWNPPAAQELERQRAEAVEGDNADA